MSGIRSEDRKQLNMLNGVSSSMRDASGSSAQLQSRPLVWTHQPTLIPTPSNTHRPTAFTGNPYGGGRMSNTLRDNGRLGGNRTANRTVLTNSVHLQPPAKRSRTSAGAGFGSVGGLLPTREGKKTDNSSTSARKGLGIVGSCKPEPTDFDSEDVNQVQVQRLILPSSHNARSTSPDPLDSFAHIADHPRSHSGDIKHAFESSHYDLQPLRNPAEDRASTKRLQKRVATSMPPNEIIDVDAHADDEVESIHSFSEPEPQPSTSSAVTIGGPLPPPNSVRNKIEFFENSRTPKPKVPEIDLRKHNIKPVSKKNSMKPKKPNNPKPFLTQSVLSDTQAFRDPIATSPSGFRKGKASARAAAVGNKAPEDEPPIRLPLEAWYLGCKLMADDDKDAVNPRYWLTYTPGPKATLAIYDWPESKGSRQGRPLEEFRVEGGIQSTEYTMMPSVITEPVVMSIRPVLPGPKPRSKIPEYNPGSRGLDGMLTFKFLTRHANWDNGLHYERLVKALLARISESSFVKGRSAGAKWEHMQQAAEIKHYQLQEGSDHASRGVKRGGSSASPDPDNSKRRPAPRPAYKGVHEAEEHEPRVTRKSARVNDLASASPEPDELILVYPPSGAGALNINKSDVKRLDPGCYLNDTLIEFGLKLWLADLGESDPELAEQVHVFSSFFYKKINVKDKEEGYRSVRKWTSKFDLFKKKYVIVPINENFHWYLAIIYRPEYVLLPPIEPISTSKPLTRKRKRESEVSETGTEDVGEPISPQPRPPSTEIIPDSCPPSPHETPAAESEGEREVESLLEPTRSCSLGDSEDHTQTIGNDRPVNGYPVNDESAELNTMQLQYPESCPGSPKGVIADVVDVDVMDVDVMDIEIKRPSILQPHQEGTANIQVTSRPDTRTTGSDTELMQEVQASKFFGSASTSKKGKQKAVSPLSLDEEPDRVLDETPLSGPNEAENFTYILSFDSLGSKHPQAARTLRTYLQMEAKDKKGLEHSREAQGKSALVPSQPNYCDCGVYVLHFVRTFLKNPDWYFQLILSTKAKGYSPAQRKEHWLDDQVKDIRSELAKRINTLAELWKRNRAAKEKQSEIGAESSTTPAGGSDDEIIIEDGDIIPKRRAKGRVL